jgi:hypothetical protein
MTQIIGLAFLALGTGTSLGRMAAAAVVHHYQTRRPA